jgi:neutral ceramidase
MRHPKAIFHISSTTRLQKGVLVVMLLLSFCFLKAQTPLKAGAAKVNVTPPIGTVINGDFLPNYAKEIHDSLFAKALAFDNGTTRFVFVVVDCMGIDIELITEAKRLIQNRTGLLSRQVMVSSTHAHSCGAVHGDGACPADLSYRLWLPEKICESVTLSLKNLKAAKIAWGQIDVPQHPSCRRWFMKPGFSMISPFGDTDRVWMNPPFGSEFLERPVSPTDAQVGFLAVKSLDGKWISIMANYSIHYAADVPERVISADYFGEVHRQLKEKLATGDDFVGIMSNGTSGDVNTFDFKVERNYPEAPFAKSFLIANDVTDSIIKTLRTVEWVSKPVFKTGYRDVKIYSRKPSPEIVEKSRVLVASTDYRNLNTTDKASNAIARLYALEIALLSQYQPDFYLMPLQAIRLGDGTIGTMPGEIFSETGLKLKKDKPCKYYFTICLANFRDNYIPPAHEFKLGGYETWLCAGSQMEINAEEKLRTALKKMVISLQ